MKVTIIFAALLPLAMAAAGNYDGNSKCQVSGFKPSFSKIEKCCLDLMGGSNFDKDHRRLGCTLPIKNEGPFRKCVKDLGYATVVDCEYGDK
ncbi:hypothetical protein EDD11_006924 [Mortierella claussenii]|nr:hypothetical protein EDD11_006924 [Mortierella claussenii]